MLIKEKLLSGMNLAQCLAQSWGLVCLSTEVRNGETGDSLLICFLRMEQSQEQELLL